MMAFGALQAPLGPLAAIVEAILAPSVATNPLEDLDDVMAEIDGGQAQAWAVTDGDTIRAIVVTKTFASPGHRQCFIAHCAGEGVQEWIGYLGVIEEWARLQGCDSIELYGRPGWQRLLGWDRPAIVLRKAL